MATLTQNVYRAIDDFNAIENAIVQKGVPVPDGTPTSEYGEKILSIQTGVDTSGDTVVPSALREGYTAHNAAGQEITGTIPNYDGSITEGAVPGAQAKYEEGVADGKQAEYDAFWDAYQDNGERTDYTGAFQGRGWNDKTFAPKYNIIVEDSGHNMFNGCKITDLKTILDERGLTLDTSKATGLSGVFGLDSGVDYVLIRLPEISAVSSPSLNYSFQRRCGLVSIDKLILSNELAHTFTSTFLMASALTNLTIEGTIGQTGFNVSYSPLNKASLTSIINALSTTTTGLTVTLRLAAVNDAFETSAGAADGSTSDEWTALIATKPNWTINLINS